MFCVMSFLYFAYGVGLLVAMNVVLFIVTLIGHQFLDKQALEYLIYSMFYIGLAVVGFFITRKAQENKLINASILSLMLVTVIGGFIFMTGHVPKGFNLFLFGSFIALILGSGAYMLMSKKRKTS